MTNNRDEDFQTLLRTKGFTESDHVQLIPLTGGVSSEIYLVQDGDKRFVVKCALEKLKVKSDWFADTSRNHSEQAYIRYVGGFRPDAMPEIYRSDSEAGLFSMEFLDGFQNWKQELLVGKIDPCLAKQAGALLGEVHSRSWGDLKVKADFDSIPLFDQLRIDPYLRTTAEKHTNLKTLILAEADRLMTSRQCLIHGDYSPKNMLHRDGRLVPLDCEVACYADAAFDLAFFLNHLFLKALYHAPTKLGFDDLINAARAGYRRVNAEHADEVESHVAHLLPMLLLARVDGKSPVDYLSTEKQDVVRDFSTRQLLSDRHHLDQLQDRWFDTLLSIEQT